MWMSDVFVLLMLENWKFCQEKHLPRVSGVDRKSSGTLSGITRRSLVMPDSDPWDGFFYVW